MDTVSAPPAVLSGSSPASVRQSSRAHVSAAFSDLLATARASSESLKPAMDGRETIVLVGRISAETPTVSELLRDNQELAPSTWDIIYSKQNRDRDYTKIKPGTCIYYNRETAALSWSDPLPGALQAEKTAGVHSRLSAPNSGYGGSSVAAVSQQEAVSAEKQSSVSDGRRVIVLGRIDSSNPTVSHLLKNHPDLKSQTWSLLAETVNEGKPFERIPIGTEIRLNPKNMEISWKGADEIPPLSPRQSVAQPGTAASATISALTPERPAANLSEAVQQYLGTSYEEMNCYELVVRGLRHINIAYTGKNGLYSKLTRMAADRGLAPNAYLNGEGLIKAAGSLVLSKNYGKVNNWQREAATLVREIEPLLDNGQILSFSTEKKGHTGVISRRNNQWTFINSGRLDNPVNRSSINHGVGEEILTKEIGNWFKTAEADRQTLTVTLGRLEQAKIQTAYNPTGSVSRQI